MQLAIATVCLSGTLEEKLQAVAGAGFRNIEIFENDPCRSPGRRSRYAVGSRTSG